jgi:hypothetical protein
MKHCTSPLCFDVIQHQVLGGRRLLGRLGPRRASKHLLHSGRLATHSSGANSTSNSAANSAANSRHNSVSQLHQHAQQQQQQQQQQQLDLSPDQHHKHHIRLSDSGGTTCDTSYCLLRLIAHCSLQCYP